MREEIIGDARLILGDCRDILPTLGKVDAVVTDPPYGTKVTEWDNPITDEDVREVLRATIGPAAFFYSNTRLGTLLSAIRDAGYDSWTFVWHKPNAMGFERKFAPQWVPIVVAYRGGVTPFMGQDLGSFPIVPHDFDHPTPKPVNVTAWMVEKVAAPRACVLDPYMGSGTAGVACVQRGRAFLGVEIDQRYFDIACRRIEEAYRQPRLFDEPPPKPTQPRMFGDAA